MNKKDKVLAAQKIRNQYVEKDAEEKELDVLHRLDKAVKRPAKVAAYGLGVTGSLVMGTGMCYAMEVLGKKKQASGIVLGVAGMLMVCGNYPLYKKNLASRKKKYAKTIVQLSEKIMQEELEG